MCYNAGKESYSFYLHLFLGVLFMQNKSVKFAMALNILFMIALALLLVFAPSIANWYCGVRNLSEMVFRAIVMCFYACAVPAAFALGLLLRLLLNVNKDVIFDKRNTKILSCVSYCSVLVSGITAIGAVFYLPFSFIAVAFLFLFLIIRILVGCFKAATLLKQENELTI